MAKIKNRSLDENMVAELVARGIAGDTFRRLDNEKKGRIYSTAVHLFGKYGYDGLSVDEFCREASISKGSFFQYFPSKSHLLECSILIFEAYLNDWVSNIRSEENTVLARDRIRYLTQAMIVNLRFFPSEESFYLFVTQALDHSAIMLEGIDLERPFRNYVKDIILRGEETGEIRGDIDIEITSQICTLVISAFIKKHYHDHTVPRRALQDNLVSILFDGISGGEY